MEPPPIIQFHDVSLTYDGRRRAVDRVTFEVAQGSIFALVGPNGAGKTSTLRLLATLADPTSGRLLVDGLDPTRDRDEVKRRLGYLPDHFSLYEQMSPRELLDFFARCHGIGAVERRRRSDELLEELELASKADAPIRSLSRGMRQRLGLAKTLVHQPRLLLLDEPASALDPAARLKLREVLLGLRRRGLAIVISSHILPDLAAIADTVGIMESGRMVRCGSIEAIARQAAGERTVYWLDVRSHGDRARRVLDERSGKVVAWEEVAWEQGATRLAVEIEGGPDAVAELVEALVLRGVRGSHVAPRESALEAIYRASAVQALA